MRKTETFEAYLDDFNTITIFLSKNFYNGKSDLFFLRDEHSKQIPLRLISVSESGYQYYKYTCGTQDIIIGGNYDVIEEHSLSTPLRFGLVTKCREFDERFAYNGSDLGIRVINNTTKFALWAPTAHNVKVSLNLSDGERIFPLTRTDYGVFRLEIKENLHGIEYNYYVSVNGQVNRTLDPYAVSGTANEKGNVIIDFSKIRKPIDYRMKPYGKAVDATIIECSVRDFSMNVNSGIPYSGTFKALHTANTLNTNGNVSGFDYLADLGVTHVQLMPVYDFATVDELNKTVFYNWGYDPVQYNVTEGSYTVDPRDGMNRINELVDCVNDFHKRGIRVNLDVVYNHVYDIMRSSFEKTVPYYYFRCNSDGDLSNGSFCGNDFDSKMAMNRKFIVESCEYWMKTYGVDGFRFDLMGIIDIATMMQVVERTSRIKDDVMIYGEGWNMPTTIPDEEKTMIANAYKTPAISYFNDFYRDHTKGKSNESEVSVKGFLTGDSNYLEAMKACLVGNSSELGCVRLFDSPAQSINYVECHDNHTLWDKLKECCKEDSKETRLRKHKMITASLFVSQGIPFMQLGQEFCRSKNGIGNSYNSPDVVNQIDWLRKDQYHDVVDFTKDFIQLRKKYPCFRLASGNEITEHVRFDAIGCDVLIYTLHHLKNHPYQEISVYFNPSLNTHSISAVEPLSIIADMRGIIEPIKTYECRIEPYSIMVVGKYEQ